MFVNLKDNKIIKSSNSPVMTKRVVVCCDKICLFVRKCRGHPTGFVRTKTMGGVVFIYNLKKLNEDGILKLRTNVFKFGVFLPTAA